MPKHNINLIIKVFRIETWNTWMPVLPFLPKPVIPSNEVSISLQLFNTSTQISYARANTGTKR